MFEFLKESTRLYHARTEKRFLERIRSLHSTADYAALLGQLYTFAHNLERAVYLHISDRVLPDLESRRRSRLLAEDLATLGEPLSVNENNSPLNLLSFSEAAGALYVYEGSTMGAPHILAMLRRQLPGHRLPENYFSAYGDAAPAKFMFLKQQFSAEAENIGRHALLQGACKAFENMEHHLQPIIENEHQEF